MIQIQEIEFPLKNFNLKKENKHEIVKWVDSTVSIKDTYKSEYITDEKNNVIRPQIYQMVKEDENNIQTFDDNYKFLNFKLDSKDWMRMEIYQEFNNGERNISRFFITHNHPTTP